MGCEEFYYRKEQWNAFRLKNSRVTYWPAPTKRQLPPWVDTVLCWDDPELGDLITETYSALNNDARVLAALGLRTVFDRAAEDLGVDPALTFREKLDALEQIGKIGRSEKDALEVLTDAGGAAAHRGWKPSVDQLQTLMEIGEQFRMRPVSATLRS
jgi:hypothetical protein